MNPFILAPQERLAHWKEFRKSLGGMAEGDQLQAVADYWALAPLVGMAYDIEQPQEWPSPWEMINAGDWCRNSVAIGMEFTLRLAGWDTSRLQLTMIRDWDISEIILLLVVDDQKVLNYNYSQVSDYPETKHDVVGRWHFCGKTYSPK